MMSRFLEGVRSSTFVRNIALLTSGTIVAQSINIVATPILSRVYSPADFGLVAVYTAVVAICATLITLRYELRVLLPDRDSEAKSIVALALVLAMVLGGILALFATTMPDTVRIWLGLHELKNWLTVAVLAAIGTAIIGVVTNWFNRRGEYKKMAGLRIAQAVIAVIFGIVFGLMSMHNGMLYAQVITLVLSLSMFLYFGYSSLADKTSKQSLLMAARNHCRAPVYMLPTAVLDVFTLQLPFILISYWFSREATGQYRMAWTLLGLPSGLVGGAIAQVFYQRFSHVWPNGAAAKTLLVETWKMLGFLGIVPLIIVVLFGKEMFIFVLGDAWSEAGSMAAILAPMFFVSLIHSPTSTTFVVMGLESKLLLFGIAVLIYRPFCLYLGRYFNNIYLGLALFVAAEIVQILVFQYIAIRKLSSSSKPI